MGSVWRCRAVVNGEHLRVELATGKTTRYPIEPDQWSVHFNISRDGKLFAGDGGAPNMVARARNGKWIYLFTPQTNRTLKAEKLVNLAKHNYGLEPNVKMLTDFCQDQYHQRLVDAPVDPNEAFAEFTRLMAK